VTIRLQVVTGTHVYLRSLAGRLVSGPMWGSVRMRSRMPGSHGNGPPCGGDAKVFDPRADDSSMITGAVQLPLCGSGEQFTD